ncbi:ASCH domain-containing protein [Cellulomonas alba]|uniref:ASCH domain-containing protein n=1 Tax=Cellulomonas alba TaxID=3053467 RepID=A0ABT7SK39_9CELL|nr:ASCH domain-containing protein [Cellulomonas alba]MDM7856554.1 ASCH domain-containing protein [Cellulomonas alba]
MTDDVTIPTDDDEYADAGIPADGDDRISAFWQAARGHLGFGKLEPILGGEPSGVVPPPSFSYGVGAEADAAAAEILAGARTSSSAPRAEFGPDDLPQVGAVAIVLDAQGEPRALIRTTDVVVTDETVTETYELVYPTAGPTPPVD